ncbi:class I mannose-6-phosphate isomerase [Tengunoibacter tsumagoiensis]|uniref:Mannose-6-phosphate isomerase n=1 Tax=Tengunoibacter tsumagoiensis TaxID=2014871 RepID=A0A402A347_9CHLR|nr:class I mannose-6-phosphate isomerase [Tengunoibacter tsumagoiensis]GCE13456.1 hypothetical protein KTT_33150 [Tengunoibacter tsumagoiensis]
MSPHNEYTYRTHPIHHFSALTIQIGQQSLATLIQEQVQITGQKFIVIDGFVGIQWELFIAGLQAACEGLGLKARWLSTEGCFLSEEAIQQKLESYLTADPVFGQIFHGTLADLWDPEQVTLLKERLAETDDITVLSGFGASLLVSNGFQIYVDVPKDRGQELAGDGRVCNVGLHKKYPYGETYKHLYFIDWQMLNRIKRQALSKITIFVDGTDSAEPRSILGTAFRAVLHELSQQPFRVKPWFAPGVWGGQWMKENFGLPPEKPNYAWSFELIAPENGLLLGDGTEAVECSFDYLLWQETDAVLGKPVAARYGSYFPIRFDYLDTMGGTNLSCQVHPRVDYIRNEFGEPFTQDETYYIVTCDEDARVYLGLHEETDIERFKADAYNARERKVPFEIDTHVNSQPAKPHDLFLIPSGTVHCSGANNLVLEISATPYIYTFKIYDYLRSDLAGNLRHTHLEHAFANIDETRRTSWVRENLCPQPLALRSGEDWTEYSIGNIDELFFGIHRLEFSNAIHDQTAGKFVALNLVEGERCEIVTANNETIELRFAESIIVPASVAEYTLRNLGEKPCKVVKAYVK